MRWKREYILYKSLEEGRGHLRIFPQVNLRMELFRPTASRGGLIGLLTFLVIAFSLTKALFYALAGASQLMWIVFLIPLVLFIIFGLVIVLGFYTIRYQVTPQCLAIKWMFYTKRIPWTAIKEIQRVTGAPKIWPIFGANWSGYCVGAFSISGLGVLTLCGTRFDTNLVVLKTSDGIFGITPQEIDRFLATVGDKAKQYVYEINLDDIKEAVEQKLPFEDLIYLALLGLNLVSLLGYLGYLVIFFPWRSTNPPRDLVLLAVIAVVAFLINLGSSRKIYQNMPAGSYLLWATGLFLTWMFFFISIYTIN